MSPLTATPARPSRGSIVRRVSLALPAAIRSQIANLAQRPAADVFALPTQYEAWGLVIVGHAIAALLQPPCADDTRTMSFDDCFVEGKAFQLDAHGSATTTYAFSATRVREE